MNRRKSSTCIAAIKDTKTGKIMMASERRVTFTDGKIQHMHYPKIRKANGIIIAASGDGDICTLLVDRWAKVLPVDQTDDPDDYMYEYALPHLKEYLKVHVAKNDKDMISLPPGTATQALIAKKGSLYDLTIYNPDGINEGVISLDLAPFPAAIGSGGTYAVSALLENEDMGFTSRQRLQRALKTASRLDAGCGGQIDIMSE